jgi:hypothetical protein
MRKTSTAKTLSTTKRAMVTNVNASRVYTKRCVSEIIMLEPEVGAFDV